jgi:hypothetical protein
MNVEFRPCKACGKKIFFAKCWQTGKTQVLDSSTVTVYQMESDGMARPVQGYPSHFTTCTDPNRFSKRNREPAQASLFEGGHGR